MMNEPTNSAMAANVSRKTLKKLRPSLTSRCCSAVISAPVSTCVCAGTALAMRSTSSRSLTPSAATTLIASILPGSVR